MRPRPATHYMTLNSDGTSHLAPLATNAPEPAPQRKAAPKPKGPAGYVHSRGSLIGSGAVTGGEGVAFDDLGLPYHVWSLAVSAEMMRQLGGNVSNPLCLCGNCTPERNRPTGCMLRALAAVAAARAKKAAANACSCGRCRSTPNPQPAPRELPPFNEAVELERHRALMLRAENAGTDAERKRLHERAELVWGLIALHRQKQGRDAAVLFNVRANREGWIKGVLDGPSGSSVLDG